MRACGLKNLLWDHLTFANDLNQSIGQRLWKTVTGRIVSWSAIQEQSQKTLRIMVL
jgi:hypothetical protein